MSYVLCRLSKRRTTMVWFRSFSSFVFHKISLSNIEVIYRKWFREQNKSRICLWYAMRCDVSKRYQKQTHSQTQKRPHVKLEWNNEFRFRTPSTEMMRAILLNGRTCKNILSKKEKQPTIVAFVHWTWNYEHTYGTISLRFHTDWCCLPLFCSIKNIELIW